MATIDPYSQLRGPVGLRWRKRGLSKWFREYGEDQARERGLYKGNVPLNKRVDYIAKKRAEKLETLTKTTKELREYFNNFESIHGYDLTDIRRWSLHEVRQVEKYGEYLHHLTSQPHSRVAPRSKKQKLSLQTFTGQNLSNQKAYVVHKTHPDEVVKVTPTGHVIITRELKDGKGTLRGDYYFFRTLLGWQPFTWDDVYAATGELLPYMPEGMYFIYSTLHGEIDAPQPKRSLLQIIQRYRMEYNQKNFAQTIAGFKRIADSISSDEEYSDIYYRRQRAARRRKQEFDALTKRAARKSKRKPKKRKK